MKGATDERGHKLPFVARGVVTTDADKEARHVGPDVWLNGPRPTPTQRCLELALEAVATEDKAAIAILSDAMLEDGYDHPAIMSLVMRIDLAPTRHRRPFSSASARRNYFESFEDSHMKAAAQWPVFRGVTGAWARAVLASMLFGQWSPPMMDRHNTKSPWQIIRRMHKDGDIYTVLRNRDLSVVGYRRSDATIYAIDGYVWDVDGGMLPRKGARCDATECAKRAHYLARVKGMAQHFCEGHYFGR